MRSARIFIGLLLTMVGTVWLVDRLDGVRPAVSLLARWSPLILVTLGGLQMLVLLRRSQLLAPVALIAAGVSLLLIVHGGISDATGPLFWPLVVLAAGPTVALFDLDQHDSAERALKQVAFLRTRTVVRTEEWFEVGKIRALLGNLELDLSRCKLPMDAELHIWVGLGHIRLIVPERYQVSVRSEAVAVHVPTMPSPASDRSKSGTVIDVSVLGFAGGVEIRPAWSGPVPPLKPEKQVTEPATAAPA